jgi:hypothetical protein
VIWFSQRSFTSLHKDKRLAEKPFCHLSEEVLTTVSYTYTFTMSLPLSPLESNLENCNSSPTLDPLQDSACSFDSINSRKVPTDQLHDSIRSIFSEDEIDEEGDNLETTLSNNTSAMLDLNSSMMFEPGELDQDHLAMVQEDWQVLKESHESPEKIGSELIETMITLEPSSAAIMCDGDLNEFIVDTLEHIIYHVAIMEPGARESELDEIGDKLLQKDMNAKLLHKSILHYLESKDCLSSREPWETTFRDIVYKLDCMF